MDFLKSLCLFMLSFFSAIFLLFGIIMGLSFYIVDKQCNSFEDKFGLETFRPEWDDTCYVKYGDRVLKLKDYTSNMFLDVK